MEQQSMHQDAMMMGAPMGMSQAHHHQHHPHHHQQQIGGDGSCANNTAASTTTTTTTTTTNNSHGYSQGVHYANSNHSNLARRVGQGMYKCDMYIDR
jgi:hypothetical protein